VVGRSLPEIDLVDPAQVERLAPFLTPESALILAASVKRQFGDSLEAFRQNMAIVENLCKVLRTYPVRRIIFMSSAAVYGEETTNMQISEATPVNPTSYYGINKYAAERLLKRSYVEFGHTKLLSLRPPLVYGPGDRARTYGPAGFCASAVEGGGIQLWGDGTELREFLYVGDLCRVIEHFAANEVEGEVNVVSGISYSFADIVSLLKESFPDLKVNSRARSKQKADNAFDARKIRALLPMDWEFTALNDGLARLLENKE
jgi:UDP-glucose 4-epimerase